MPRDILAIENGKDLGLAVTALPKAVNVLSVQLGDLEYATDFGVDKEYFLNSPYLLKTESYKYYLVERLARFQVNVAQIKDTIGALFEKYAFTIAREIDYSKGFTTQQIIDNVLLDADGSELLDADGSPLIDG